MLLSHLELWRTCWECVSRPYTVLLCSLTAALYYLWGRMSQVSLCGQGCTERPHHTLHSVLFHFSYLVIFSLSYTIKLHFILVHFLIPHPHFFWVVALSSKMTTFYMSHLYFTHWQNPNMSLIIVMYHLYGSVLYPLIKSTLFRCNLFNIIINEYLVTLSYNNLCLSFISRK